MKPEETRTRTELIKACANHTPQFTFFWGHRKAEDGTITKSCFSQWYDAPFQIDNQRYPTAEHYMMAAKAKLFNDAESRAKILRAGHPGDAKKLGRRVKNFDGPTWEAHCFAIVVEANIAKFSQNREMGAFLLATGNTVLVEASPRDTIWGIGLSEKERDALHPAQWKGENLLGFALMEVRARLRA